MSETPIGTPVQHQEGAGASAKPETGAAASDTQARTTQSSETQAGGQTEPAEDPIAGLKSALGKERERAGRLEKETKAEKRERQKLAMQLQQMTSELATLRTASQQVDPKALADKFYSGPETFVTEQVSSVKQEIFKTQMIERVETSKELARDRYEDFDEVEAAFLEAAQKDASLWNGVNESRLPALLVYKRGKKLLESSGAPAAEDRIAKLEAEIASLRAGRDGGQTTTETETVTAAAQKPSIQKSNVGARGTSVGKTTTWAGPTPDEKIWGRQRAAR
jgi:hypothetical protein